MARFPASGENPYLDLLDRHLARRGLEVDLEARFTIGWLWRVRGDVSYLHFHWRPDRYYLWSRRLPGGWLLPRRLQGPLSWLALVRFAGRLAASRLLGYRVVWTIHEVYPPETGRRRPGSVSRRLDRVAQRFLARCSDLLLAHDQALAERARSELGRSAEHIEIVPHGSYAGVYPLGRPRSEVRTELKIPEHAFAFLCFGAIRPDKEIELLLDAFRTLALSDVVLVIAGRPEDSASVCSIVRAFHTDGRIRPILGWVPAARVAELFAAADAAVLPRSEIWTSGSLILALSLGLPIVAARLPPHEELLGEERAGWLFEPGDAASLRGALERAAAGHSGARAKSAAARRQAETLPSWDEIAQRTASLILVAGERRARS